MKIIYLTPRINNEGGVARILAVKTNELIQRYGYSIAIATQNGGDYPLFFDFNSQIERFDFELKKGTWSFISNYRKAVHAILKKYNPDVVIVTDNGLKGYLFRYLIRCSKPVWFEVHGSKFNVQTPTHSWYAKKRFQFQVWLRQKGLQQFDKVIFLSNESRQQWHCKNSEVIPNINWIDTVNFAALENPVALCIARNSYEKGLDRLFFAWSAIIQQQPHWKLHLITESQGYFDIKKQIEQLNLEDSVRIIDSQKDILKNYLESSIYLMTSHNEGLPMVLIEAMSAGLPVVAYDCPIGPRSIITNSENGFLVADGDVNQFVDRVIQLMEDPKLRLQMGKNAIESAQKYQAKSIIDQWHKLFQSIKH